MDRVVDGDVQLDTHTERDLDAATRDVAVSYQRVLGAGSEAQGPPEAASHQLVVGDIPVEPPGFQPRAGLLADLDRAGARVSAIQAAAGLHGLGATQLAAAYARAKLEAGWRLVAWVSGADTGSLLAGLAAVADATGLAYDDSGHGIADAAATVRDWLEIDGERCLLVFDNVSDLDGLQEFVPARGSARVLITGTWPSATNLASVVPVDVFSSAEAAAFLTGRTGLDDEVGAAAVAAVLGHLPLALALAAPVIAEQHAVYVSYLDRLQATPTDMSLTGDDGQPYPPSFAQAVLLSLQAVRTADPTGACTRVMEIMSVLSSSGVRRELLYAAGRAGVLASGRHRVAPGPVDRVLEWLGDRSLVTFSLDSRTVIVHPLVARVIRDGLERRKALTAVCEAAAFALDVYSQSRALVESQDRRAVRGIPQQVTALLGSLAGSPTGVDEELAWLLLRLQFVAFYHLLELGDSTPQAIAVGEPLTQDLERLLGPDHPDTLNSRNSLATAYLAAGRVAEAIPLFEQALTVRQRVLGPDNPETLISQNNLASAYQDAGRTAEAIRLYELNLEVRERLLGADHPSTLNSQGNLAAAYQDAGRVDEAIPLLERTLAGRERVLGPDHPDTQTSRKNLARAYRDAGRADEAIPLLERTKAGRKQILRSDRPDTRTPPENLASASRDVGRLAKPIRPSGQPAAARKAQPADGELLSAGFQRPPADQARRMLPASFRRPPVDSARQPSPSSVVRPPAKPTGHSAPRMQDPPDDVLHDRDVVAAVQADDPAGMAMAYDRYAADLYGYCHWMLHDSADAAVALKDTFAVAAVTLSNLSEPVKLRPWLFALARNECRRRIRPTSAARDEATDPVAELGDGARGVSDSTVQFGAVGGLAEGTRGASDSTVQFAALSGLGEGARGASDSTVQFRALGDGARGASDSTVQFAALSGLGEGARGASDSTVQFSALSGLGEVPREAFDATTPLSLVSLPTDATMPFLVVSQPPDRVAHVDGDQADAELRSLIDSILAGLKPREREVIELSFRHDLHDDDLAIALGVSWSRAHALAAGARRRLEEALNALHIALTRREACPELGELLADWHGQLTEETRELVSWHIKECQTCARHEWGALRPTAFSRLLPPAPLPPELREQVLSCATSSAEDAVAYRRRVARRADSVWFARFSRAITQLRWASIRAHPGTAIAAAAIAVWVLAAVGVTLLTFFGSHAASAQAAQPTAQANSSQAAQASVRTPPTSPAAAPATAAAPGSTAGSSPAVGQTSVSSPGQLSSSLPAAESPTLSPSHSTSSPSPKPSKSPSPKPSKSPSPSPSHTSSPSPSPSHTSSPSSSSSPSPTA